MLLYTKRAAPKEPKRRSRAGCTHCKLKKKKCDEKRPCQRCIDYGATCEYETQRRSHRPSESHGNALKIDVGKDLSSFSRYADTADLQSACSLSGDDDTSVIELHSSEDQEASSTVVRSNRYPDLAMIAPSPVASPLLEFNSPVFAEFSAKANRRALLNHFCNTLSHLIVLKEDSKNPFRQLVLPLSYSSSPVLNAIYALASAHLEYRGVQTEESSLVFHNKALQSLAQLIDCNDNSRKEEILGAIMLLVYYEALVQRGGSHIVQGHLKGAMTIMSSEALTPTPTSHFLTRAFGFYDVITALSLGVAPNSAYNTTTTAEPETPGTASGDPASYSNNIDVLLGMSTELWPVIERLAHLSSQKQIIADAIAAEDAQKASDLRLELDERAKIMEMDLSNWTPSTSVDLSADGMFQDSARIQSMLFNAEAYRYSSLVYLYRNVQDLPRDNPKVQNAVNLSLQSCEKVVDSGEISLNAPMAALLWPLFVASCEAINANDRILARRAFTCVERRQGMRNIICAWDVVQELWDRIDGGEVDADWREISRSKDFNLVFG